MKCTSGTIDRALPEEDSRTNAFAPEPVAHSENNFGIGGRLANVVVTQSAEPVVIRDALRHGRSLTLARSKSEVAPSGRDHARSTAVLKALDHLNIGLFLINRQGYVTDFNDAGSELLGIDHTASWDQRHVANLSTVFPGDVYEQFDHLIAGGRGCLRREITVTGAGNHPLAVTLCALPLKNDPAAEVVGIIRESDPDREQALRTGEELTILAEVAAALSSSLELKQILRIILTGATASQGLGFNRAFLFLYDRSRHDLTAHMAVGPSSAEEAGRIWSRLDGMHLSLAQLLDVHPSGPDDITDPLFERIRGLVISLDENSLLARICDSGACLNLEKHGETSDDQSCEPLLSRIGTRHVALIPLMSKGKCQGLIVADNAITGASVSDDSVRVLKVLADQAAVAIQRARLHDSERERTRELERTYRRLAQSQDQIIRAEKMSVMGELTAAVAEELRNPLTIMSGFVSLAQESHRPEDTREFLNVVASEVRRADALLHQVIEFASASSRQNQVFDYSVLTANTVDKLLSKAEYRTAPIRLSVATEKLPVFGNPDQLGNALHQLLMLVVDETSTGTRLEIRTESYGSRARLSMSFITDPTGTEKLMRSLEQMFSRQTSSLRLQILMAGETIKYHGGDYRLGTTSCGNPLLVLEMPLARDREEEV